MENYDGFNVIEITRVITELKTRQEAVEKDIDDIKVDIDKHFDVLYAKNADMQKEHTDMLVEIKKLPEEMVACGNKIRQESIKEAQKEAEKKYVSIIEFKVLKAYMLAGITIATDF